MTLNLIFHTTTQRKKKKKNLFIPFMFFFLLHFLLQIFCVSLLLPSSNRPLTSIIILISWKMTVERHKKIGKSQPNWRSVFRLLVQRTFIIFGRLRNERVNASGMWTLYRKTTDEWSSKKKNSHRSFHIFNKLILEYQHELIRSQRKMETQFYFIRMPNRQSALKTSIVFFLNLWWRRLSINLRNLLKFSNPLSIIIEWKIFR